MWYEEQICLIFSFTACLISLILQQYMNGLIVEFDSRREVDKVTAKLSDGVFNPVIVLEAPTRPYGRKQAVKVI